MANFFQDDYDYTIIYGTNNVSAKVRNTSKRSYSNIPSSVIYNGVIYTVTSLNECFYGCSNLQSIPSIPNTVKDMSSCFSNCSIDTYQDLVIPEGVEDMTSCFEHSNLNNITIFFPSSLKYADYCFYNVQGNHFSFDCIPKNVISMDYCFAGSELIGIDNICIAALPTPMTPEKAKTIFDEVEQQITLIVSTDTGNRIFWRSLFYNDQYISIDNYKILSNNGDYLILIYGGFCRNINRYKSSYEEIPLTVKVDNIYYNITSLNGCFRECIMLKNAPKIPSSITDMTTCFYGCTNLEGPIIVENDPSVCTNCFSYTLKNIYICSLNKSNTWKTIADNYNNVFYIEPKGNFIYLPIETTNTLNVKTFNDDACYLGPILPNVEIPNNQYNTTSMDDCFYNMHNLKSVSIIPSYITSMNRTFCNCDSLSGTIHVYNNPISYTNIFDGTSNTIYIIPHSASIKSKWETIARLYNNVKVLKEPIIDLYQGDNYDTISFGGYDEDESKIVSYLDFVGENNVYITSDDLSTLIDDLNWNEVEI